MVIHKATLISKKKKIHKETEKILKIYVPLYT